MENKETKVSIMSERERERKDNNNDGIRKNENAWAEWNRNVLEVERLTGERGEEERSNSIKCSKFVFEEEGEWAVEACPDLDDPPNPA